MKSRILNFLLFTILTLVAVSAPCIADKPLPLLEGEYRLGDSPQTPEDGLAWLTVDTDGPDWKPFLSAHGHPAGEFTNVWRRYSLPESMIKDPTLYLNGWPAFEAYIDGRMVYQAGVLYPDIQNKFANHTWHLVPLPSDFAGKYIYFRTFAKHPDAFSERAWISVASRSDNLIDMVRRELAQAIVGLFLTLIGCGATFVYIRKHLRPALSLGIISVSVGLSLAMHTDIASMLFAPGYFAWYLTHIPLYAFPIGLWRFLDNITEGECPLLTRLWQIQALFSLAALAADVLDYYPMHMTTPFVALLSVSTVIAVIVTFRYLRKKRREPGFDLVESKLLALGVGILVATGSNDLLGGFQIIRIFAPLFHFGALLFVILLVVILERRFTLAHDQLRAYSRDLESRVEDRTRDLGEKNDALEKAMTDLQEAQQQLVLREKMASLGDLVAGVAHEVNAPIGAVNSSADVADRCVEKLSHLIDDCPDAETLKNQKAYKQVLQLLRENTGLIKDAGKRVARIVRSLRNFARLDESGFQTVDIHEGIDSTLDLVQHQMKGRIEVIKDYGDNVGNVECYPNQLNQVFMNLLVNAAQAIDDTGAITITTESVDNELTISIQDTGRGISEEHLERIFDPGFTTKSVDVGTGLGLAISYKIIENHGGRIEVESEPRAGSTFKVIIPVHHPESGNKQSHHAEQDIL